MALGGSVSDKYWNLQRDGVDYETSVIAIHNHEIIGTVFTRRYDFSRISLKVRLGTQSALAVNPDFRGQGIALALMQIANDRYMANRFDVVLGWPEYASLDVRAGFKRCAAYYDLSIERNTERLRSHNSPITVSELMPGQSSTVANVFECRGLEPVVIHRNAGHESRFFVDHGPTKRRIRLDGRNRSYAIVSFNSSGESVMDDIHGFSESDRINLIEYAIVNFKLSRIKHIYAQDRSALEKIAFITDLQKRELFAQSYSSVGDKLLSGSILSEYF